MIGDQIPFSVTFGFFLIAVFFRGELLPVAPASEFNQGPSTPNKLAVRTDFFDFSASSREKVPKFQFLKNHAHRNRINARSRRITEGRSY